MITAEVKITTSGMLKAGKAPPVMNETVAAATASVRQYYTSLGGHYAVWGKDVQGVVTSETTGGVAINNKIIKHQITGGIITGKGKLLTIPLVDSAVGVNAPNYPAALVFIKSKAGNLLLVEIQQGEIRPIYLLRPAVSQPPVPKAIPDMGKAERAATGAAEAKIQQGETR